MSQFHHIFLNACSMERNNYTLYNSLVLIIVLTTCIFYFTDLVTAVSQILLNYLNYWRTN